MRQVVQAFQVGSSTVMTLPKGLGIVPGQKLHIIKGKQGITVKPEKKQKMTEEEIDILVEKLAGGVNLNINLTPDELNKLYDESYEDVLR